MAGSGPVAVDVLGPLRARDASGVEITPGGDLQRRLLALLVLRRGEVVSTDAVTDALWPGHPPADQAAAVQTHVFRLRRWLPEGAVTSVAGGYRLDRAAVAVDADLLADAAAGGDRSRLEAALAAWRGAPYPELADTDDGRAEARRLDDLRTRVEEARAHALLVEGRAADVVVDLVGLTERHPLRERPVELLMAALEATGRTADALRAYDDFRRRIGEELGIDPSPALAAEHTRMLGIGPSPAAPDRGRHRDRPGWVTRLPVPAGPLIGRDTLVTDALALTAGHRLVTLLGTGGVGKTRLAVELAHLLAAGRPDRPVVLCELAGATSAAAEEAVASALGIESQLGAALRERIAAVLQEAELVLVLDNCEHVLEPIADLVDAILHRSAGVRVLATSQERLRIPAEQLCPVPPLPDAGNDGPGVELFVARAGAVRPGWEPSAAERAIVAGIVRRLDGLPLAIELAAARVHTLEVHEIAAGLDRRFRLLTTGSRASTRHRSLHAAVSWSVDLLDPPLRDFLAAVSVFAGPFSSTAAADVTGVDRDEAADHLHRLVERSLAVRAPAGRFALLETLRAFAAELLAADDRAVEVADRHAACMLAWVEDARVRLTAPSNRVLEETDVELPDLRLALERFVATGEIARAGRLVEGLANYGFFRLRPEVLRWAEQIVAIDPEGIHHRAGTMHATVSLAAWMAGDITAAGRWADRAVALATQAAGDAAADLPVLVTDAAASQALFEGRLDDAVRLYVRSQAAPDADSIDHAISASCEVLALAYAGHPDAEARAAALLEQIGGDGTAGAAYAWYAAGETAVGDDPGLARRRHERAMALAEATGASFVTGAAGATLASLEVRDGDADVAVAAYRWLIDHWRRVGMWSTQWTMLRSVARLLERLDRHHEAAVLTAAVTSDSFGHAVFGDDAVTLAALGERLRRCLGEDGWNAAVAQAQALDRDGVVELALQSL